MIGAGTIRLTRSVCVCLSLFALVVNMPVSSTTAVSMRSIECFNSEWRFTRDDPSGSDNTLSYTNVRAWLLPAADEFHPFQTRDRSQAQARPRPQASYALPEFDDSRWRVLTLPHDWGIEGPFHQDHPGETGKLAWWGVGWYRKAFHIPDSDAGRRIYLDIDGAMAYSMVWLNGHWIGGWPYGYSSFRLDLTPWIQAGRENVLAIRLDNPEESSRWYPGAGIYRNVWLVKTDPVHVAHWGVFVTTPRVTAQQALVDLQIILQNHLTEESEVEVVTRLYHSDANGRPSGEAVASAPSTAVRVAPGRQAFAHVSIPVAAPRLWRLRDPHRYVAITSLSRSGKLCDEVETPFGIRSIAVDSDKGFFLNGERVQFQGVCMHHDLGALGSAIHARALQRQIEMLQEMGCNAIRTSHNPPAPELLELCDRMGMLVMDEAFDCWRQGKKKNDYHLLFDDWHEADLRALVRRDRNHPCVVLWSIGNEVPDQWQPEGWKLAAHLAAIVREEDRSRFITSGFNNTDAGYNGFQKAVDIVGFNYKPFEYGRFHQHEPSLPVMGSETSSCVSSRGEYYFPVDEDKALGRVNFQVSSYDLYAPPWAFPPDVEFRGLDNAPYALGEFVWTGFDYLGEPTPYGDDASEAMIFTDPELQQRVQDDRVNLGRIRIPSRSSYFGIIDLAGFKKDRFFLYQSRWRSDRPMAHILPHWNWPERTGQVTPVHVYTSGDEAELFLNNASLGKKRKAVGDYRLRWDDVVYEPGELRVQVFKGGEPWAQDVVRTTGPAARLRLSVDRDVIGADGQDLAFVTLAVQDEQGFTVPRSGPLISYQLSGPGQILALDNGDATSHSAFQSTTGRAYNGQALIVIRSLHNHPGVIRLEAKSSSLASSFITIQSK